jgi:uncharacterized protein YxjI
MRATLVPAPTLPAIDPAFQRKRFLLRQKMLRISEKYSVWDENGNEILFVHRPVHVLRQVFALLSGFIAGSVVAAVGIALATLLPEAGRPFLMVPAILGAFVTGMVVAVQLSAKRHVTFYRDDACNEVLLRVLQDQKFAFLRSTYTVETPEGEPLARLDKNMLHDVIRRCWHCRTPDGKLVSRILEDSIPKAIARRFLGPMLGLLRTNFVLYEGDSRVALGRFDRKLTIRDHYVLDLTADRKGVLDPRVALAIGVMLDTGERR